MIQRSLTTRIGWLLAAALAVPTGRTLAAQGARGGAQVQAPARPTARAAAPIDLTGYWVSLITEDWRWRMVTPAKGDYQSIPMNPEGKNAADAWDPAKDEAAGESCRAYGAAAIMRVPGRLHVTWQDDNTLKVETDAGTQTRLFHFGGWTPPKGSKPSWQGDSIAEWEVAAGGRGPGRGAAGGGGAGDGRGGGAPAPRFGNLKVITTNLRPGYLRKNGVPYSGSTVLTEYWDLHRERNGEQWIVITASVDDPKYLQQPYIASPNFLREPDGTKWDPTPCSARW